MERVFDLGPNTRFVVLNLLQDSAQHRKEAIALRQALFGFMLKIREACLHRLSPLGRDNMYCTSASLRLEGVDPNNLVFPQLRRVSGLKV
jgi:hypothetical protein